MMTGAKTNITLVQDTNRRNRQYAAMGGDDTHTIIINLDDWNISQQRVRFPADNFPYVKLAILDKYLEDTHTNE